MLGVGQDQARIAQKESKAHEKPQPSGYYDAGHLFTIAPTTFLSPMDLLPKSPVAAQPEMRCT